MIVYRHAFLFLIKLKMNHVDYLKKNVLPSDKLGNITSESLRYVLFIYIHSFRYSSYQYLSLAEFVCLCVCLCVYL